GVAGTGRRAAATAGVADDRSRARPAVRVARCPGGAAMSLPPDLARRLQAILESPTYRLAYEDPDLPGDDIQRAQRLQLELLRPERALRDEGIDSTVVVFGSARVTDADTAQARLAALERGVGEAPGNVALARALGLAKRRSEERRVGREGRLTRAAG